MATVKTKGTISTRPGLVSTTLRGSTYLTNSFPGTNISSNGRPSSLINTGRTNVKN